MSEALKNEIHAYFGAQNTTTTAPVKQWAYGQKLIIHDNALPSVFEAYYSNSKSKGDAKPQIGQGGEVRAPYEYFKSGADIYVFLMQHEGEEDGRYNKVVHIPITPAPKPVDIDPDPEESLVIGELVDAMNSAVAQCGAYVEHYPTVIDGEWCVWDEATEQFVTTGVPATGNGIASAQLNQDYTLTLTFTDGTTYTTPSIRGAQGEQGEGGLSILLTRQAIVLPTDNNRIPQSALTASVEVTAVKGTEIVGLDDVSGSSVNMEYIDGQGRRHGTFVMPTIEVTYDDIRDINVKYKLTYEFKTSPYYFMADSGNITLTIEIDGVTHTRTIPWTLSKQGIQGVKGDVGTTPDLTIGTVQTLPAGSQATASITGTDEEPVLNLGLPKGDAGDVSDVQINGTSILADGVANIPIADVNVPGAVRIDTTYGLQKSGGYTAIYMSAGTEIKAGTDRYRPITPLGQHAAAFYGLAKAAGADMASISGTTIGVYPEAQKSAISTMLNAPVTVTGTTPTITAKSGIQYICGEVATLDIILPDSGIVDVVFTSGAAATLLTVTPPTGQTVRWANGFDATALEANTTYEVNFLNGMGVVGSWT